METKLLNQPLSRKTIDYCVNEINNGNIGILPTDTVYGIGCNALNINAIQNLYHIKDRKLNKPINVLVSNIDMVKKFTKNINDIEQTLIKNFWPGALTIIFDKSDIVPNILTSSLDTVGIRMPDNKICLEILENFDSPLAMSSANISDELPDNNLDSILKDFNNKVSFIINDRDNIKNIPSTIVRVEDNKIKILRKGIISKEDIIKCFGGNIDVR